MKYTVHNQMTFSEFRKICRFFSKVNQDEYFESKIRGMFPESLVLDFNLGRSALQHAFRMMNLRGKEVLLPAYSCPFFSDLILKEKVRPIFLDANPATFNVTSEEVQEKVSKKTAAVVIIHTYGSPCEMKPLLDLKEEFGFFLIEDCAHAFGAEYRGKNVGCFGDVSLFSMYKTIPNFGGGFLVINAKEIFRDFKEKKEKLGALDFALLAHSLGIAPDSLTRILGKVFKIPSSFRARLEDELVPLRRCNDFVKAIFNFYFDRIPKMIKKKEDAAKEYSKRLRKIDNVFSQRVKEKSAWMNYSIRISDSNIRDNVLLEMEKRGILCDKIWCKLPITSEKLMRKYPLKLQNYKNSAMLSKSIINLPLHHNFGKNDISYICDSLSEVVARAGG